MRRSLSTLLMIAVLFGTGYWYYEASAVCDVPIEYRIGSIDEEFDITHDEVRTAVSAAESIWEDGTGRNLFTYDADARLAINFVFDERQEYTEEEQVLREELEEQGSKNESLQERYEILFRDYELLRESYERQSAAYEERLQRYNAEVEQWNEQGGAPEEVYKELDQRKAELSAEQERLNDIAHELNQLISEMNSAASEGNLVLDDYNEIVEEYNERFNQDREFTQGDFQSDQIHIYQFDSEEELVVVIAHELGHALSVPHVEGRESFMYHFMNQQSAENGLSEQDVAAFQEVCGENEFSVMSLF